MHDQRNTGIHVCILITRVIGNVKKKEYAYA